MLSKIPQWCFCSNSYRASFKKPYWDLFQKFIWEYLWKSCIDLFKKSFRNTFRNSSSGSFKTHPESQNPSETPAEIIIKSFIDYYSLKVPLKYSSREFLILRPVISREISPGLLSYIILWWLIRIFFVLQYSFRTSFINSLRNFCSFLKKIFHNFLHNFPLRILQKFHQAILQKLPRGDSSSDVIRKKNHNTFGNLSKYSFSKFSKDFFGNLSKESFENFARKSSTESFRNLSTRISRDSSSNTLENFWKKISLEIPSGFFYNFFTILFRNYPNNSFIKSPKVFFQKFSRSFF